MDNITGIYYKEKIFYLLYFLKYCFKFKEKINI